MYCWKDNRRWTFHWRKHYYELWTRILARSDGLKLKHLDGFVSYKQLFTSQDVDWWTGVVWITCLLWCFYQLFGLSFWRHPFTAEDPLVSKWCNAEFINICSDKETNVSTTHLGRPEGKYIFSKIVVFGWTIALLQSTFWDLQCFILQNITDLPMS